MVSWGRKGKSNTKYVKFRGKAVYIKPYVPDEYNGKETWKCGLTVDKATWQAIKEAGSQVKKRIAEDIPNIDENTPYVVFSRDVEKEFKDGIAYFCPPFIYDESGERQVWYETNGKEVRQFKEGDEQPERKGDPIIIGNGSDVEFTIAIYPAGSFGHGSRLESIRVIDLIEWIPPEDEDGNKTDTQSKAIDASKKTEKKSSVKEVQESEKSKEDEAPFDVDEEIGW